MTAAAAMGEGVAPSQSPYVSEPLPTAPSLQTQTQNQSPAPGTPILEDASADAAMKKSKMQKVAALALAQNPTFEEEEEQGEEAVLAAATARKKHKEHSSAPSLSAAAAAEAPTMEEGTMVIKEPKRSKEEEEPPGHSPLPLGPGQAQSQGTKAPHVSKPLPAATFLEALAPSPAPGTPMLEEAAASVMGKRNICMEQKVTALILAQNTALEEQMDDAMSAKMNESKHINHTLSSPSTTVAAETTIWEQDVEVTKNQKHSKDQELSSYLLLPLDPGQTQPQGTNAPHASKPLSAATFLESPAQSPAPGTPMLKEAAVAMMMKRKICKEQKVPDLYLAQNTSLEEQREDAMEAKMKKESKNMEHTLSSCSTSVAAETTIWKQELKVTKKQKQRKQQEPSRKSPLQLDPGHTHCVRSQGGKAPPEQEREAGGRMRSSIKINNGKRPRVKLIKEASKKKPVLPEGFVPFTDFASSCTEQNPDHSSAYSAFFDQFLYNPVREDHKPPLLRTPDRVARLPSQGHSSLESSPGTPMLEEASAAVMSKRNICKEQKVPELSLSQITTLEEPRDDALAAKMKESKHIKHTLSSPSTSVAAETTIWEQEVKVTKKQKHSKDQELSSYSLMPLDPGQTQPQGTNAPHASKPLSTAPFREATAQSAAPGTPMLKEVAAAIMRKRKISKEQKLPDLSLAQNTSLEEQREDAVEAKMKKESKNMEHTLSSCSTSVAAETTIWKQELKVTKKQKQRKQQEPSRKSPLQLDPGHTHCVRSQGGKAPPEQEREAGGRMRSSIKINNGKRPRVLSKRELIKEASKKKPVLPEGFVPFTDFASSCTEQNPDHSSAYSAFFDQFRYNPVGEDHKPPLLRTPDRVARLPSRGQSSLESSPLTANETSWAAKFNTSVASKRKHLDSGSDSQEKLNVDVKENPQKKKREKKPREPSGNSLPFDPSQTCCIQLDKAPPEQYQGADAPKVDNIKNGKSKKGHVCAPSKRELFKEMSKEQVLPEGFLAPSDFVPNCTEQNPVYTSRSAASLYQFCYGPACQDRNPQPPGTTDRLSMLPPRGYPSFELCELFANGTSKANISLVRKLKKKDSGSGSSYGSQEKLHAKEKKNPEKKMGTTKQREPPPLLTPAEKCSDKYRRVSLDQLVPPPRSPHNLLQEEYASDPWKVIVICMLLNLTHGKQVKNIIEGFFECYPDAQSAVNADPEKMAGYLAYLGLQRVKTTRIQKFSKEYVEKEWTYITELCGVGKYAADAYAIFCAGRATEVVPKDHKLVDYWKYVCFELSMMQESQNV